MRGLLANHEIGGHPIMKKAYGYDYDDYEEDEMQQNANLDDSNQQLIGQVTGFQS